jgi:hypothetical protein
MGVFTDKFDSINLKNWLVNYKKVDYKWENPIEDILLKIKIIYEG